MKINNVIIILFLLSSVFGNGQTNCKNGVSTNPLAPTNTNLPNTTYNGIDNSEYFLNRLDWTPTDNNNLGDQPVLYSPSNIVFDNGTVEMNSIMHPSIPAYNYLTATGVLEPLVINGWELLLVNLGYYPDNVNPIPHPLALNKNFPYIVLYNKYSGVIRVYTNFGKDSDAGGGGNAMTITIGFELPDDQKISGAFRLYEGSDRTLDKETNIFYASAIVQKPASGSQWASADFQVAYDPCTCYNFSTLQISTQSSLTGQIELHGRSVSLPNQNLTNGAGGVNSQVQDFINNFHNVDNNGTAKGGMTIYKAIDNAIDDYIAYYDKFLFELEDANQHNEKVKRNLIILKVGKIILQSVISGSAATLVTQLQAPVSAATLVSQLEGISSTFTTIVNGHTKIKTDVVMEAVKTIFGEAGKTFIANNFELKDIPSSPSMPTVTLEEMFYSGSVEFTGLPPSVSFFSPGAYGGVVTTDNPNPSPNLTTPYQYPVYNEVLGTFALLESPKIKISKVISNETDNLDQYSEVNTIQNSHIRPQRVQTWNKEYQISLDDDLKYALNDVLDIKDYQIKAAYDIRLKPKVFDAHPAGVMSNSSFSHHVFYDGNKNVNIESTNTNVSSDIVNFPVVATSHPYGYYNANRAFPATLETEVSEIKIQTPYIPVNAFKPFTASFGLKNELIATRELSISPWELLTKYSYSAYTFDLTDSDIPDGIVPETQDVTSALFDEQDFDVYLKLMVDIEFETLNSDGVNNSTTLMLTYKVDSTDIIWDTSNLLVNNLINTTSNVTQYANHAGFGNIHFNGQQVDNCNLNGSSYTCKAYEFITIDGDVSVANGYTVTFEAGSEIYVINESNISPEAILQIKPVLDYSNPMPKVDQNYVSSFCKSKGENDYLANSGSREMIDLLIKANKEKKLKAKLEREKNTEIQFDLFPNPTTNSTTVVINDLRTDNITIQLKDVMGKEIPFNFEQTNSNSYNLDVNHLESGVYFVTVSTYGAQKTKRLVIQ